MYNPEKLYSHVLRFKSWPKISKYKKHKAIDHCRDVPNNLTQFRNKWKGKSGIYKITYLPYRLFTYYGSSVDLSLRFKYHYFNTPKKNNYLGLFLRVFGWSNFSITVIELCNKEDLIVRENWYLARFNPLLNFITVNPTKKDFRLESTSLMTRSKISASLIGRKDSLKTRLKKSKSRLGNLNPFFGVGPGKIALDKAVEITGTKIYAYDASIFALVNNTPFRSIRETVANMPISATTLSKKVINSGKPFKGYYYYSSPQYFDKKE